MNPAQLRRRWHPDTVRLVPRMEQAARRLAPMGPRVMVELLLEIGCAHDCLPDVAERLGEYSRMAPEAIRAAGADRLPPRRLAAIPTE